MATDVKGVKAQETIFRRVVGYCEFVSADWEELRLEDVDMVRGCLGLTEVYRCR